MTGPDRPVRQPPNTRASVLLTGFLRLAAFPWMPETRASTTACQRRGSRTADAARPADADDSIVNLPGSFPAAAARPGGRIVRAVGGAYTAARGKWAPAGRPVRVPGGVYTGGSIT